MVYIVSDFHGNREAWYNFKNALGEEDIVFMLGDACDRGAYGIEILKEVKADRRFRYILGNHDDFILRTYRGDLVYSEEHTSYWGKACWKHNTNPSYWDWEELRKEDSETFDELVDWLAQCDVFKTVVVNDRVFRLAHAKYPQEMDEVGLSMSWMDMEKYNSDLLFSTLWDRYTQEGTHGYTTRGAVSIIGHTPGKPEEVVKDALYNVDGALGYGYNTVRVFCLNDCNFYYIGEGDYLMSGPNNLREVSDLMLEGFVSQSNKWERNVHKVARATKAVRIPWTPVYCAIGTVKKAGHKFDGQRVHTSSVKRVVDVGDTQYIFTRNSCYRRV